MIRKYDPHDLAELMGVWYDAAQIAQPFWTSKMFDRERSSISEKFLPIAETWVFEEERRVVGFIALLDNEVGGIFVSPRRHGRGIGRALMDHARASRFADGYVGCTATGSALCTGVGTPVGSVTVFPGPPTG